MAQSRAYSTEQGPLENWSRRLGPSRLSAGCAAEDDAGDFLFVPTGGHDVAQKAAWGVWVLQGWHALVEIYVTELADLGGVGDGGVRGLVLQQRRVTHAAYAVANSVAHPRCRLAPQLRTS